MAAAPRPLPASTESREKLIFLLQQASEAEHSLCCQYLYAAFSLRRLATDFPTPRSEAAELVMAATQQWAYQIFFIARQEMAHLAVATNLLTAIGEHPHLPHGDYPDAHLECVVGSPMVLARCSEAALRRFQYIERPKGPGFGSLSGVERIYGDIREMFSCLPANVLFTGEGERQLSSSQLDLGVALTIPPVTNRPSAIAAIDLVLAEGEGQGVSPLKQKDTHYGRFTALVEEYAQVAALAKECGLEPSLPVVGNPVSHAGPGGPLPEGATLVTNEYSAKLMDFFNDGYQLMLIMLQEFLWGYRGYSGIFEAVEALKTPEQIAAKRLVTILSENAYFPFMTMFIRPIGELLARLPAFANDDEWRAGASFQTGDKIPTWLPTGCGVPTSKDIESYVNNLLHRLDALGDCARRLSNDAPDCTSKQTLAYLAENLSRMQMNVRDVWNQ